MVRFKYDGYNSFIKVSVYYFNFLKVVKYGKVYKYGHFKRIMANINENGFRELELKVNDKEPLSTFGITFSVVDPLGSLKTTEDKALCLSYLKAIETVYGDFYSTPLSYDNVKFKDLNNRLHNWQAIELRGKRGIDPKLAIQKRLTLVHGVARYNYQEFVKNPELLDIY